MHHLTVLGWLSSKSKKVTNDGVNVENREPLYTIGKSSAIIENSKEVPQKN
jgi:hypothetical protein